MWNDILRTQRTQTTIALIYMLDTWNYKQTLRICIFLLQRTRLSVT